MKFNAATSATVAPGHRGGARVSIHDIAVAMRQEPEGVAVALLGEPNRKLSSRCELRWGSKGALRVHIAGPRQGTWVDENGGVPDRGDVLALVVRQSGGKDAGYAWARRWIGDTDHDGAPVLARVGGSRGGSMAKAEADTARRRAKALQLWESAQALACTQAEDYLRARGLTELPQDAPLRFLPSVANRDGKRFPAMVARISMPDGAFCAVHLTFLDREGAARKAAIDPARECRGPLDAGAIWLTAPCARMIIGEGIESALSLWLADTSMGVAAATNDAYSRVHLPADVQDVTIAVDVDEPNKKGIRAGEAGARKAAAEWAQ